MVAALGIYTCLAFVPLVCYTSKNFAEVDQEITLALSLVNAANLRIKDNYLVSLSVPVGCPTSLGYAVNFLVYAPYRFRISCCSRSKNWAACPPSICT